MKLVLMLIMSFVISTVSHAGFLKTEVKKETLDKILYVPGVGEGKLTLGEYVDAYKAQQNPDAVFEWSSGSGKIVWTANIIDPNFGKKKIVHSFKEEKSRIVVDSVKVNDKEQTPTAVAYLLTVVFDSTAKGKAMNQAEQTRKEATAREKADREWKELMEKSNQGK